MVRASGANGQMAEHGALAAVLKAAPFLQPYVDMLRALILKIYLITVAIVNKIVVMLVPAALVRKLTGRINKNSKRSAIGSKALDDEDDTDAINLRVRIMGARNLPQMDKGSCDCYVRVKLAGKEFQTKPAMESLNPEFSSEFKFETRKDSKGTLTLELWDYDVPGDDFIGLVKVSVSTIVAQRKLEKSFEVFDRSGIPVKNTTTRKPTKLRVCLSYDTEGSQGESEWLNGILRKGCRCLGEDVDAKVREEVSKVLATIPAKIPVIGSLIALQLEHYSIGTEAPFLNELRLLPTRSAKDVQLRANLRWVTSGEFGIKISAGARFLNKLGLRISVSVTDLEIDFPVWVQAHLDDNLKSALKKVQIAATGEPRIRVALSVGFFSTRSVPGLPEMIEVAIRNVLKKKLVLPQKISKLMGPGPEKPIKYSELERAGVARVSVKILEADNITAVQAMSTLDPFVVATMMGSPTGKNGIPKYGMPQDYTTKNVIAKKAACEWNEFFQFIVTDVEKESIQFQLFDKGVMSDDPCGKMVLHIAELAQAARAGSSLTEEWYNLTDCKTGRIRLAVEYAPFVPDDGPTETDDHAGCHIREQASHKNRQAPVASDVYGSLCLQMIKATGVPKTLMGGKPNAYVTVSYVSYVGSSTLRTSAPESDCNPEWHEDMVFREKLPTDKAQVEDKDILVTLNDSSSSSMLDGDPYVASAILKLKEVLAKPGEFELMMKDKSGKDVCPVVVKASFEQSETYSESVAAIGSDWLNGILRKGWLVFCGEVDKKVREEVRKALQKISHPDPDPETGKVKSLPGIEELVLEDFSIGKEPPFFLELKLLNTQSAQDVQLLSRLRWVCGEGMIIKVKAQGKTGIPDVMIQITNLEIYFPAWIQIRLAGFGTGLGADSFELGATELPDIKMRIDIAAGVLPTGLSPATIDSLVKTAVKNVLVLPKKIQVCLAKDPSDATGRVKMAGNLKGKSYPKDPATGQLLVATDDTNTPLYSSIDAFKEERLKRFLTDLEKKAVGRVNLKIIEAHGLPDPEGWGMVNAFAEACMGSGQESATSTHLSTSPVWNQFMDFLVVDEKKDVLCITVRDRDLLNTAYSIELGYLEIKVADLLTKTGWREAVLPLQNPQIPECGQLRVAIEYAAMQPLTGPLPPEQFAKTKPAQEEEEEEESPFTGKVIVTVEKAENLIKLDWTGGGLDPYVTLDMGSHSKKTPTNSGLNPIWNKTFAFDCEGCGSTMLCVAVKDAEKLKTDRMVGIVTLKLEDLVQVPGRVMKEGFVLRNPEDRQVVKDANGNTSILHMTVKYVEDADSAASASSDSPTRLAVFSSLTNRELDVTSRELDGDSAQANGESNAAVPQGSLFVRVIKAADLQKMDFTGLSDPYVSVTLNGQGKDKTRVINSCLDPEWNEDFHFHVDLVEGGKCEQLLILTIKDDDIGVNQFMGKVEIPVQQVIDSGSRSNAIFEILDKKGKQVIGKSGKGATITLDLEYQLV